MESARLFVAILLPEEIKETVSHFQNEVQRKTFAREMKWVAPENLHLTLKFIGWMGKNHIEEINEKIKTSLSSFSALNLSLEGTDIFPEKGKPRTFCLGLNDKNSCLTSLAKTIEKELLPMGIPEERRSFSPHITLARFRNHPNSASLQDFLKYLPNLQIPKTLDFQIHQIHLMQSFLHPNGSQYVSLRNYALR